MSDSFLTQDIFLHLLFEHNYVSEAKLMAGGLACIALVGAGVGVGTVFGCLLIALSRNPFLEKTLFPYAILGFALTEAVGLLGLMMSFLLLFL